MKYHRRLIASLRWIGSGVIVMGLMGGLGGTGIAAEFATSATRVSQMRIAGAKTSASQTAYDEGIKLIDQKTAESARQAIAKFEEALQLFRIEKDRAGEVKALSSLGLVYAAFGLKQKTIEYYSQALTLERALGDRAGEALTLYKIGRIYSTLGEKRKAIEYYSQTLPLLRGLGDHTGEANALTNIGNMYAAIGEKKALDYYNQALSLQRKLGDREGEATNLTNLGAVYSAMEENQKSLEYFTKGLILKRALGDREGEATTLNNVGYVYNELRQYRKALEYYTQALPLKRALGDRASEATTLNNIGYAYKNLGEKQKALDFYNQALTLQRALGNRTKEAAILSDIGAIYNDLDKKQKALEFYSQSLALHKEIGNPTEEARILNNMGGIYNRLGDKQKALEFYGQSLPLSRVLGNLAEAARTLTSIGAVYNELGEKQKALDYFNQSLPLSRAVKDYAGESSVLNNIGAVYNDLGENQKALDYYNQSLKLKRTVGDRTGEARIFNNIGTIYNAIGENQKALDYYNQSLFLSRASGDRTEEARVLGNIGALYDDLGERKKALEYYTQVLPLRQTVGDRAGEAATLNNIGTVYNHLGERQKALDYISQALPLTRAVGDREAEATTLTNIGSIYAELGEQQKALDYYNQALPLSHAVGDRSGEATTLTNIGSVHNTLGEQQKALDYYNQALPLKRAVGDRSGEATTLGHISNVYRSQGKLKLALEQINSAIVIIDDLRLKISSPDLRASYFSTVQYFYQAKTKLLMQLHQKYPEKGYDKQAFETSDRARARSFIELLVESGTDLQPTVENSALFEQERNLQQSLRQVEQQRVVALSKDHTDAQAQALDRQSETFLLQLQDLTVKIRATNPSYAALKYPQPLTLAQLQQQVLDPDTLLLQYSLGAEQSYLWAVTANGIQTYILPKQATLEAAAKKFRSAIVNSGTPIADTKRTGDALYQLILAPVANQLPNKRLLIVADGVLQYTPFAALPLPNTPTYTPLLKDHENINAPSASSVAVLRQQKHSIGPKTLAVLADPVFRNDDARVAERNTALDTCAPALADRNNANTLIAQQNLPRDLQSTLRDLDLRGIQRLPGTRQEAEKILSLVPPDQRSAACAFAASYGRVTQPQQDPLSQYRIVHFATHGFINSERPQFSGLVLSLVDAQGKPKDGFLRLGDIFNLKLAADLVVLSACQTGLGKEINGEGIVGLTRGFMYAGSKRVVASLWSVDDAATAQLMGNFYRGMLKDKQTPAVALRNAQLQAWQANPDPRLWAAFTLQGEWRP